MKSENANNFEIQIKNLDLSLFSAISSQTSGADKTSLLALQNAIRELIQGYVYLEIGSYLGGSIQTHLIDNRCSKIISIDKRPDMQPDERGLDYYYLNNLTSRMIQNLKNISEKDLHKVQTIDGSSDEISTELISVKPNICFIDGEHTDKAAWLDFLFCLKVTEKNSVIVFHDSSIIYNALTRIVDYLRDNNYVFNAYNLPDAVFVIELGDMPLHSNPLISRLLINNHIGYLKALDFNDHYRRFSNTFPFLQWKKLCSRIKKNGNVFD